MKLLPLYPSITDSTSENADSSYMLRWIVSMPNTESNVNVLGGSLDPLEGFNVTCRVLRSIDTMLWQSLSLKQRYS